MPKRKTKKIALKKYGGSKSAKNIIPKQIKPKHDINQISFKGINDDYSWGRYGSFKVIIMKANGYINATKICNDAKTKNGKKKEFKHWKENNTVNELINEISLLVDKPADQLFIAITGGKNEIRGTYVHPDLIPHIASWASPTFAVKVSQIINKYFIRKAIKEKEKLIKDKDDKIGKLGKQIIAIKDQNDILLTNTDFLVNKNKKTEKDNKKMSRQLQLLLNKNDDLYDLNEEMLTKMEMISNDRVIATDNEIDQHMLIIIKNNDDPNDFDEDEIFYQYHALRVMKKSYKNRIISHRERHPNMKVIQKINYSPNAMNLWIRIKQKLGSGRKKKLIIDNCKFNLKGNYTEKQFLDDIMKIHNERLNYDID